MGCEVELLEPIIHRIQSFLTGREAAATTILSKSWYSAWLTRPDIDLDEADYFRKSHRITCSFPVYAKKTIQRYEQLNLKIDSFSLRMPYPQVSDPYDKLIVKALKLGATRLKLHVIAGSLALPNEVFAAENLIRLDLHGFLIDLGTDEPNIRCSKLESLTLTEVGVKHNFNYISIITSRCPLIKYCSLSYIYEYEIYNDQHAPRFLINMSVIIHPCSLIYLPKMLNIRCLVLSSSRSNILYMGDLWSEFPSLKDLTLNYKGQFSEDIRVSSRSLERLKFTAGCPTMRVEFDVPNIRMFIFEGPLIQSLSFKPVSREWESHLSITCRDGLLSTSWLLELSKLVAQFRQSKLYLYCWVYAFHSFYYEVEKFQGLPKLQVENLTTCILDVPFSNCFLLFDGLFRICQPKFITQDLFPTTINGWKTNNTFLCKMLEQQINENCSGKSLGMHSLHDLEEVKSYVYDGVIAEWQEIPLKSLLHASASPKEKQKICFRLKWRG